MADLLLHKNTRRQLELVLKSPPHALLICGQNGSGKLALAEFISADLLRTSIDKLFDHPYFMRIQKPEGKQEIPIESIRGVIRQLKLKPVMGNSDVKRIVLIEDADLMSSEAQNALLKAIEEPPSATMFILSSLSETAVLPTIASRSQKLKIGAISRADSLTFFKNDYDEQEIISAWQLAGGTAGLMSALLRDDNKHELKIAVENAKKLLRLSRYERLLYLDQLSGNKAELATLLEALSRILAALHRSATLSNNKNAKKLITARKQIDDALSNLDKNTSPRLVILNLALSLLV